MADNNNNSMNESVSAPVATHRAALMNEHIEGSRTVVASYDTGRRPQSIDTFGKLDSQAEISNYLSRPLIVATGTLSDTSAEILYSDRIFYELTSRSLYADKLSGYLGMKAKVVYRLQVNGNPFQQGRLLMSYEPFLQDKKTMYVNTYKYVQLPHVELDISHDTEVILEIPYVSAVPYYNRHNYSGDVGTLHVTKYGPFRSGTGSANCAWTLWAHFEDVELVIPVAQMGTTGELEQKKKGPVSLGLRKVERTATLLNSVPILSSFSSTVGWMASLGRQVADVWGWSKPLNVNPIMRMNTLESGYDTNVDGLDNARSLGLYSSPAVKIDGNLFVDKFDQMSLAYVITKFGFVANFTWTGADIYGTVLYGTAIGPSRACSSYGTRVTLDPAPVCYVNQMFGYYKGAMQVKVKLSKNKFYSGRLLLAFQTKVSNGLPSTFTIDQSDYILREILDVRECSEWIFTLPYMSTNGYTKRDDPYGMLNIFVLDPLVAPDTCAGVVDIIVEMAGTPDMEFSFPSSDYMAPMYTSSSTYVAVAQMGDCLSSENIGGVIHYDKDTSDLCVGERVVSLKQMCQRTSLVLSAVDTTVATAYNDFHIIDFDPNVLVARDIDTQFLASHGSYGSDLMSVIGAMYALQRGGVTVRFKYWNVQGDRAVVLQPNVYSNVTSGPTNGIRTRRVSVSFDPLTENTRCGVIYPDRLQSMTSVTCPQYNTSFSRIVAPCTSAVGSNTSAYSVLSIYSGRMYISSYANPRPFFGTNWMFSVYRQGAEDFHFGFFTYAPSFIKTSVAAV